MIRDRLDEIIMEFYDKAGMGGYLDARGMAEEIFRHGVERTREADASQLEYHGISWTWDIQPEPVGEKCPGCLDDMKWHRVGCPVKDRRKGQRRKGFEARGNYNPNNGGFVMGIYLPPFAGVDRAAWLPDRRTDKDRRK